MSTARLLSKITFPQQFPAEEQNADDDIYGAMTHFEKVKDVKDDKTANAHCPFPLNTALIALHLATSAFRKGHVEAIPLAQTINEFIRSNWEPISKDYVRISKSKLNGVENGTIEPFVLFPDFYQNSETVSHYNRFLFSSNNNKLNDTCKAQVETSTRGLNSLRVKG